MRSEVYNMIIEKIESVSSKYLDVDLYEIYENNNSYTVMLKDRFDKGQCFLSDCISINNELKGKMQELDDGSVIIEVLK